MYSTENEFDLLHLHCFQVGRNKKRSWPGPRTPKRLVKRQDLRCTPQHVWPKPDIISTPNPVTSDAVDSEHQDFSFHGLFEETSLSSHSIFMQSKCHWKVTACKAVEQSHYEDAFKILTQEFVSACKALVRVCESLMKVEVNNVLRSSELLAMCAPMKIVSG